MEEIKEYDANGNLIHERNSEGYEAWCDANGDKITKAEFDKLYPEYKENKHTKIINLFDIISEKTVGDFILAEPLPKEITVNINCQGGCMHTTAAIYWLLRKYSDAGCKIITSCLGKAFSGAAIIFMAGDEYQLTFPTSTIKIHAPSYETSGGLTKTDALLLAKDTIDANNIMHLVFDDFIKRLERENIEKSTISAFSKTLISALDSFEFTDLRRLFLNLHIKKN